MPDPLAPDIADIISNKVGEVRIDALDISIGEILNLHKNRELVINPDYQRLFRWSPEQQSRLLESVLLNLPIPQFFVVENDDGRFELIDGLQRISSLINYMQPEDLPPPEDQLMLGDAVERAREPIEEGDLEYQAVRGEPFRLSGCDILEELNGLAVDDLPLSLRLQIKRTAIRMTIIKKQSKSTLRYQMFKRLNTGGSLLSGQEIRNCTARIIGKTGIEFYEFLRSCAGDPNFKTCLETLPQSDRDTKQDEELVLRFFALKNRSDLFKGNVSDFLTDYMESVTIKQPGHFDYAAESVIFRRVFAVLVNSLGANAFVRFRNGAFFGALAPTFFEGFTIGILPELEKVEKAPPDKLREALVYVRQQQAFLMNIGPGANSQQKLRGRIKAVSDAVAALA